MNDMDDKQETAGEQEQPETPQHITCTGQVTLPPLVRTES